MKDDNRVIGTNIGAGKFKSKQVIPKDRKGLLCGAVQVRLPIYRLWSWRHLNEIPGFF